MSDDFDDIDASFATNPVVVKLNQKKTRDPGIDEDEVYLSHQVEESIERSEFLKWAAPAFLFAVKRELQQSIDALNSELRASKDRVQLHSSQKAMCDLLITSNVPQSEWLKDSFCIEIAVNPETGELTEECRRPANNCDTVEKLFLFADHHGALRVTTTYKSFYADEYAAYLVNYFLEEREAVKIFEP
jgi:hypothetical protein